MTETAYIGKGVKQDTLEEAKSRLFSSDEKLFCVIRGTTYRNVESRRGRRMRERASGLLLITSKRAMFYVKKVFGRYHQLVFPYDQISSVYCHKGMIGDELELQIMSEKVTVHAIPKGDGDIAAQNIRDMVATMKAQSPIAAVAAPQADITDQIEKLGQLKEKGLITDEEFEQKKQELLKRI